MAVSNDYSYQLAATPTIDYRDLHWRYKEYSDLTFLEKMAKGFDIFTNVDMAGGLSEHVDSHTKEIQDADYVMVTSELSTYASFGATGALMSGNVPLATVLEGSSLVLGGVSTYLDITQNEDWNATSAAGTVNSLGTAYLGDKAVSALPSKYEIPVRIVFDAYGQMSSAAFREAAKNE